MKISGKGISANARRFICMLLVMVSLFTPVLSVIPGAGVLDVATTAEAKNWGKSTPNHDVYSMNNTSGRLKTPWKMEIFYRQKINKGDTQIVQVYLQGSYIDRLDCYAVNNTGRIKVQQNGAPQLGYKYRVYEYTVTGLSKGYASLALSVKGTSQVGNIWRHANVTFKIS